jgi:hypothetical protein
LDDPQRSLGGERQTENGGVEVKTCQPSRRRWKLSLADGGQHIIELASQFSWIIGKSFRSCCSLSGYEAEQHTYRKTPDFFECW